MGILDDLKTSGVNPDDKEQVLTYIKNLPVSPDRREGLWGLYLQARSLPRNLGEISRVRGT